MKDTKPKHDNNRKSSTTSNSILKVTSSKHRSSSFDTGLSSSYFPNNNQSSSSQPNTRHSTSSARSNWSSVSKKLLKESVSNNIEGGLLKAAIDNRSTLSKATDEPNNNNNCSNSMYYSSSSERTLVPSSESELRFAPEVITSVREYCDTEPPSFLLISPDQPLYEPVNFQLDGSNKIVRSKSNTSKVGVSHTTTGPTSSPINQRSSISSSTNEIQPEKINSINSANSNSNSRTTVENTSLPRSVPNIEEQDLILRQKVRLDSLSITKYHLNGFITCASLSMDQNCYVRVSTDNWTTFQESQAIEIGDFNLNTPTHYQFDFLIPIERNMMLRRVSSEDAPTGKPELEKDNTSNKTFSGLPKSLRKRRETMPNLGGKTTPKKRTIDEDYNDTLRRAPPILEFIVVLNSFGLFYYDDNCKNKYTLAKKRMDSSTTMSDITPIPSCLSSIT
jgi:hypothetical protein